MSVPSYSAPIALLLRLKGWRLRALVNAVTVLAAVLIVSMMSLLLQGRVSGDYLLTGMVTAAIFAPLSLALLNQLVDLLAKQHEELLAGRLAETERRLNQALVETEARLRTLIDAVPDAIQFKDGEGRWQVANQVCLRLLGAEQTPWRGATDAEIAAAKPHFAAVLASCRVMDSSVRSRRFAIDSIESGRKTWRGLSERWPALEPKPEMLAYPEETAELGALYTSVLEAGRQYDGGIRQSRDVASDTLTDIIAELERTRLAFGEVSARAGDGRSEGTVNE